MTPPCPKTAPRGGDASNPRSTGTRCACSPSRTAGARSAGTPCSPPSSLPGLPVNGRTGGCTSPERPSSTTISCTTDGPGDPAIRTVIKPAWYTTPANGRYAPDSAGAQHCNPARPSGLLEPCAGKPARTVLRGPRRSNAPGLPDGGGRAAPYAARRPRPTPHRRPTTDAGRGGPGGDLARDR